MLRTLILGWVDLNLQMLPAIAQNPTAHGTSGMLRYGKRSVQLEGFLGSVGTALRAVPNPKTQDLMWLKTAAAGVQIMSSSGQAGETRWKADGSTEILNYGKRGFIVYRVDLSGEGLFYLADDGNKENFNLFRLDLTTHQEQRLTNQALVRQFTLLAQEPAAIYLGKHQETVEISGDKSLKTASHNDGEREIVSLEKINWKSMKHSVLCTDEGRPFAFFEFEEPQVDDAGKRVACVVDLENKRTKHNLAVFTVSDEKLSAPLLPEIGRNTLNLLGWKGDLLYLISDEGTETASLYEFDLKSGKLNLAWQNPRQQLQGIYDAATESFLLVSRGTSKSNTQVEQKLLVWSCENKSVLATHDFEDFPNVSFYNARRASIDGKYVFPAEPKSFRGAPLMLFDLKQPTTPPRVAFDPLAEVKLAQPVDAERITYETFDDDDSTRLPRKIRGLLFKPRELPPADQFAAVIYAHGGPSGETTESWNRDIQLLCHLGYFVLAPNPRGSTGQGKRFEDLNDHDWGGGDYRDYEYGRRALVQGLKLNPAQNQGVSLLKIPQGRIGISGTSYGGYMTNWSVTHPENRFSFGVAHAAVSDLEYLGRFSNVKAFVQGEMGKFEENRELYRQRSPITWAAHLRVPLFLTHGGNDNRVPFSEGQRFAKRLQESGCPVVFYELPGEGHIYQYFDTQSAMYQKELDFLFRVCPIIYP